MLKVNNKNTGTRCEICPKLTLKTPCSSLSIVNFEQVNVGWGTLKSKLCISNSKKCKADFYISHSFRRYFRLKASS